MRGAEVYEALLNLYKTILKLSMQYLTSHRVDSHKIEFLLTALLAYEPAPGPFSRVVSHQLTSQQLHDALELVLKLHKKTKLNATRDRAISTSMQTGDRSAGTNYEGRTRLHHGNHSGDSFRNKKLKCPPDI